MNAGQITELATAIVSILGAVGALVAVIRHQNNPDAHK